MTETNSCSQYTAFDEVDTILCGVPISKEHFIDYHMLGLKVWGYAQPKWFPFICVRWKHLRVGSA